MLTVMSATDFTDLAARMSAGVAAVRACLILSRDGLSLGAHPADGEGMARQAWDALEQIGDPQRGFVDMGSEIWVVASSAAYSAVMVAAPEAKPGLLLDRMESQLAAAEEARVSVADAAEAPVAPVPPMTPAAPVPPLMPATPEPVRRPRSPLHPEPRLEDTTEPMPEPHPMPEPQPMPEPVTAAAKVVDLSAPSVPATRADDPPASKPEAKQARTRKLVRRKKPAAIDRVALAREFGRLQADEAAGGW
jgi:hypothetical protein